jgi:hypothetical protein
MNTTPPPEADAEAPTGSDSPKNQSLTLKPSRLLGSRQCLNCSTALKGPYCYYCGQPDRNLLRFFPALMREFLEDILELDTRFSRTLLPLLFIPGKLTRDYLDGRRFRYTPPLRLYIVSSMMFFLLAAVLAGDAIHIYGGDDSAAEKKGGVYISINNEEDLDEDLANLGDAIDAANPVLGKELSDDIQNATREAVAKSIETEGVNGSTDPVSSGAAAGLDQAIEQLNFNGKPWDRETNPVSVPGMPGFINDWINDEIEESPQKGKAIEENPNIIVDKVLEILPATMFFLLPVVALLFKFWYLFARRYYFEHLIHAFHNHAFLFVVLGLNLVGDSVAGWREPGEEGPWSSAMSYLNLAIMTWIPVYLLLSLKRVYQQGWMLTILKYGVIGISYVMLLGVTTAFAMVVGFVLL